MSPTAGELLDYYITPTHDFTQYTKDYEEKYWSQDTAFDWHQSVPDNLRAHLDRLPPAELLRLGTLAFPLVEAAVIRTLRAIRERGLPSDEDALKAISECLPDHCSSIAEALALQAPLERLRSPLAQFRDELAVLQREQLELREQRRLYLFKNGTTVKRLETDGERRQQTAQLLELAARIAVAEQRAEALIPRGVRERAQLTGRVRGQLEAIGPHVLKDLEATRDLVRGALHSPRWLADAPTAARLKQLLARRQLRALKDIANHALVVEQSAIAPLTMGIIHYKRRREIQEAMTTFVNDEAKHSAVFRRFMAQKLEAKERIPDAVIKGSRRYMWLARFLPSGGMFMAVIVESIGGAYLEFFADEAHMPEPLFRSICTTIAKRDERRHVDLCVATYNELYRTGSRWERLRNHVALKAVMSSAYGDKTEDHPLIQACRVFGVEARRPYLHIAARLSEHLTRVGTYVQPEEVLQLMNVRVAP